MHYVRPVIQKQVFLDAAGSAINYGHRWPGSPAESRYSVTAHPERFAPLHIVATALIVQLGAAVPDVGVALRIDPPHADAAPIEFTLTPFPGVVIRSGAGFTAAFPVCGCDACDDSVSQLVDELEETVFAIVAGGLSETEEGFRVDLASGWRGGSNVVDGSGLALAPRDWAPWHPSSTGMAGI